MYSSRGRDKRSLKFNTKSSFTQSAVTEETALTLAKYLNLKK